MLIASSVPKSSGHAREQRPCEGAVNDIGWNVGKRPIREPRLQSPLPKIDLKTEPPGSGSFIPKI